MKAALAFAIALFASLPIEEHGICRVYSVHRETAYANYWWACGSCYYRDKLFYLATALIACANDGTCVWVKEVPHNANLGTCERERRTK